MKFALRDDDLNYYYEQTTIIKNYEKIWDICPVSMSVIPFIKGNWPKFVKEVESREPGIMDLAFLEEIIKDNEVHPIDENLELVQFINEKINENKIYLTFHSIHHRNEDPIIPQFSNNYGIGAEFYTSRDLTLPLRKAINYLESIFNQPIEVFTPPQNLLNLKGIRAITNNKLAICGDLPSLRKISTVKILGINSFVKYAKFKIRNKDIAYPYPLISGNFKMIGHQRLQPGTCIDKLYSAFEQAYKLNGTFVISTHSYGFDYKMENSNRTMGETLIEFIQYVAKKPDVQFVNLNQMFS